MILALNSGIGSAVGLFKAGEPILCLEEERFNRIKNYMGFPEQSLNYILEHHIEPHEIDYIALCNNQDSYVTREQFYSSYDHFFKKGSSGFIYDRVLLKKIIESNFALNHGFNFIKKNKNKNVKRHEIEKLLSLGFQQEKIHLIDHHECHAASAYYGLAKNLKDKYLIFTSDGGGDGLTSSVWVGENSKMRRVNCSNCYSLGNIYSMTTHFLGFKSHEHEYKIMGLAPYSKKEHTEKYVKFFQKFLSLKNDDTVFYNPNILSHAIFANQLSKTFKNDRFDNIAGGLQLFAEEITKRWVKGNIKKYGITKILGSGGTFMNVKINKLISEIPEVKSIDVFPSCGDESNIFGAAFSVNAKIQKNINLSKLKSYTLGTHISRDLESTLKKFKDRILIKEVSDINSFIAEKLSQNKIIARCSGPMEFGARALGNRSILANPNMLQNVGIINRAIKNRDFWMPFAPMILDTKVNDYIKLPKSLINTPYMMFACDTVEKNRENMICSIHQSDFTARPQIVDEKRYKDIHEILSKFYQITGIPVLLNTSYNLHGFPIVENSNQAVEVFINTALDFLIIDSTVICKKMN